MKNLSFLTSWLLGCFAAVSLPSIALGCSSNSDNMTSSNVKDAQSDAVTADAPLMPSDSATDKSTGSDGRGGQGGAQQDSASGDTSADSSYVGDTSDAEGDAGDSGGSGGNGGSGGFGGGSEGSCLSDSDCPSNQSCQALANAANTALELRCANYVGKLAPGSPCNASENCSTGQCIEGFCSAFCKNHEQCFQQASCMAHNVTVKALSGAFNTCIAKPCKTSKDCSSGKACSMLLKIQENIAPYCTAGNADGAPTGTVCTQDSACFSNMCPSWSKHCSEFCSNNADCAPVGKGICAELSVAGESTPKLVHACGVGCDRPSACSLGYTCRVISQKTADTVITMCAPTGGGQAVGADCSSENKCDTGLCLTVMKSNGKTGSYCTSPCVIDTDCPAVLPKCALADLSKPSNTGTVSMKLCTVNES